MSMWELLGDKKGEFGPWLRRAFWLPLRRMLRMFHILPASAALVLFVLLATDGQLREIYVSYLEDMGSAPFFSVTNLWIALRFAAAAAGFALISAVLFEAHYLLGSTRFDTIHWMQAGSGGESGVQDAAGIVLALAPWLGLVAGLVNAKIYLADLFRRLQGAGASDLGAMQHVPMPGPWPIAAAVVFLGLAMSLFVAANPKRRGLHRAVIVSTPPAIALLFLLLTDPPQFNPGAWQIALICLAVAALVAVYYAGYAYLFAMRAPEFSRSLQNRTGINLRKCRGVLLFIWALLPWIAMIALYFAVAPPAAKTDSLHGWAMIPVAMSWAIAIGLSVVFLLFRFRRQSRLKWWLYAAILVLAICGLCVSWLSADTIVTVYRALGPLASMALTLLFLISIFALLAVLSQQSGFPALTLVIVVLVGSVALPIPIGWSAAFLALLCLVVFGMAMVSGLWAVAAVALIIAMTGGINFAKLHGIKPLALRPAADGKSLHQQFNSWLDAERIGTNAASGGVASAGVPSACAARYAGTTPYPVYIIAVEGGGIYAASAASMFLAGLQDRDPCFSRHVFAISAVSGGAIGATIFEALLQATLNHASATSAADATRPDALGDSSAAPPPFAVSKSCVPPPSKTAQSTADRTLRAQVSAVAQGDHFSPLVASIFPELLGFSRSGRAQELAASFAYSVNTQSRAAARVLCQPFDSFAEHWPENGAAPALVLNATWVETGYRAAFAPFPLHAIDGSLYSFADMYMPDNPRATLIDAAVVSARFPAVLPPYSVEVERIYDKSSADRSAGGSSGAMRWNFVDGGYSDTSGAATALALYKALEGTAKKRNVDLRLVLLTSSDPRLKPNDIDGTIFADTLAPIDAVLSVRDGLGNEAVARACDGVSGADSGGADTQDGCADRAGKFNPHLQIVGIEDQTYGLSLGWKISQTTFSVVSWMLGRPRFADTPICRNQPSNDLDPKRQANGQFTLNESVVCANSRVEQAILQSLK